MPAAIASPILRVLPNTDSTMMSARIATTSSIPWCLGATPPARADRPAPDPWLGDGGLARSNPGRSPQHRVDLAAGSAGGNLVGQGRPAGVRRLTTPRRQAPER